MSRKTKKKRRGAEAPTPPPRRPLLRKGPAVLAACLLLLGAAFAATRFGPVRRVVGLRPLLPAPAVAPQQQTPLPLAKEYVYAGGRMVATEEPPPPPTGPAPTNLIAMATAATSVRLTWQAPAGDVTKYKVERRQAGAGFAEVAEVPAGTLLYDDGGRSPGASYLYQVRAVFPGGGLSAYSNQDIATTVLFEDDPLATGMAVRFRHVEQLRAAVEAVWALAGRPGAPDWSGTPQAQQYGPIHAWHVKRLRENLNPALGALGLPPVGEDSTLASGQPIRKEHVQDVRDKVK